MTFDETLSGQPESNPALPKALDPALPEAPFSLEPLLRRYQHRRPAIQAIYHQMYAEARRLVEVARFQADFPAAGLPVLAGCLPGAETICFGVVTIGPALETRVAALFKADPPAAYILDELGTLWVKGLAGQMHQAIRTAARAEGRQTSPAYRPGVGRWPVELQQEIFDHLPAAAAGIRLLEDFIMDPKKSISLIVARGTKLGRNCYAPEQK